MLNFAECCLCGQIAGQPSNDLIARLLPDQPYVRRVMLDTASFAVIPSLGPLTRGHSLACPKSHVRSFAGLDPSKYEEFQNLKRVLKPALQRAFEADVHLFEHGMATTGNRILCSVEHAHMHFVPLPERTRLKVLEQAGWTAFDGSIETLRTLAENREYIFYESPNGDNWLLRSDGSPFESQYMRKIVAKALSFSDRWNWREYPDAPAADGTWRLFTSTRG